MSYFRLAWACAVASALVSRADEPPHVATAPPLSPAEELARFQLPPGFEAQLVAAEPDIQKPINMAFDSRGRLWVTCTIEYPYPAKNRPGRDSIRILDDFGPDGRARKITTFADQLNIPIGLVPDVDGNGAIVYSIPNIWRLRDTTGAGKADRRDVLFTGFGHRDTHGMINGLVRGFDGWIYACHGYSNDSNVAAKDGSRIAMNSGNTFRFKPDGSHIEMMCRGQVNPFGQCLDPLGNLYTACCHSKPITQLIRGAVYTSFSKPHDGLGFGPDMVHEYRGSTALCGLAWYEDDYFPDEYRGRMFLGDVVYNCINVFDISRRGATYTATQHKADFLSSRDPWFRPVDIKLGPDGALYVADFYNRIIGHYEVPLNHPGRDRTSGRIWRIVRTDRAAKSPRKDWTKATIDELVGDLSHPNLTVRLTAMHQLVERGQVTISPVRALRKNHLLNPAAAQPLALSILERLGALTNHDLAAASTDPHPAIRLRAMRIRAERSFLMPADWDAVCACLEKSADNLERKAAAEVLGRHPSERSLKSLLAVRGAKDVQDDPFLLHTVRIALRDNLRQLQNHWQNATPQEIEFLADAALGTTEVLQADNIAASIAPLADRQKQRLPEFLHHIARYGTPDRALVALRTVQDRLAHDRRLASNVLLEFSHGVQEHGGEPNAAIVQWTEQTTAELLQSKSTEDNLLCIELIASLRRPSLYSQLVALAKNRERPDAVRSRALAALAGIDGKAFVELLAERLSDASESLELREAVAQALGQLNESAASTALLAALATAPARLATTIAAALATTPKGANALLDAVTAGKASPRLLLERSIRVKLDALRLADIQRRIAKLMEGLPPADAALTQLLHRRAEQFRRLQPDLAAGAKLFVKQCANCHQVSGQGAKIGPQLDGIGARGLERLLEDVLDPNRNVDPAFRSTTLFLKSGQSVSGLVVRDEGAVLILADNQGKELRFEKSRIESRETSPLSPMPANWADQIPERDFVNLLGYLLSLRAK